MSLSLYQAVLETGAVTSAFTTSQHAPTPRLCQHTAACLGIMSLGSAQVVPRMPLTYLWQEFLTFSECELC